MTCPSATAATVDSPCQCVRANMMRALSTPESPLELCPKISLHQAHLPWGPGEHLPLAVAAASWNARAPTPSRRRSRAGSAGAKARGKRAAERGGGESTASRHDGEELRYRAGELRRVLCAPPELQSVSAEHGRHREVRKRPCDSRDAQRANSRPVGQKNVNENPLQDHATFELS